MASKLGNFNLLLLCYSSTSINPKTSLSLSLSFIKTTTPTTLIKSFPHEIPQISRPPLIISVNVVRATSESGPNSPTNSRNSPPPPQDDLTYLLKLAAGSVLGSTLIKYGSAILPDITKPNITLALLMISTPVVIAVLLLFNGSRKQ